MSASPQNAYPSSVPPPPRRFGGRSSVFQGKPVASVSEFPAVDAGVNIEIPKVALDSISLSYKTNKGERLLALDKISMEVRKGEFLCVVGPSGCGKSTLLHLIAGLNPQTSGNVLMDGKPVTGPATDRILIFQELGLFPWLTVAGNVEFGMKMKNVPKAEREERVQHFLRLVHLSKFSNSYIHQLSGGMRQRVALARALATEPDVLLMDEPFAALDAQTRDLLHDELERIWAETGSTIIFVTHNVREAARLGDRVVLLTYRPGRVKQEFQVTCRGRATWSIRTSLAWHARFSIACGKKSTRAWRPSTPMKKLAKQAIFYGALIGLWALLAKLHIWPPYLFPPPWGVAHALRDGFSDHSFWIGIAVTMKRMLIGYTLSVVLGMVLGLGVSSSKFLEETVGGLLVSLQSLPSICWIPLAVLWFGLTEKAILFVVLMGSLLSVTIAMEDGRKQMPKIYGMAGRNLGASGFRLFWSVLLPASLPFIVNGMKQGWAFAWRSLIQAEMIFLSLGLGQLLMMGRDLSDMNQVLAVMILIIVLGYLVDGLIFRTMERRLQQKYGLAA